LISFVRLQVVSAFLPAWGHRYDDNAVFLRAKSLPVGTLATTVGPGVEAASAANLPIIP
jgi:hypothetical protein